jgi:ribosomal protein L2
LGHCEARETRTNSAKFIYAGKNAALTIGNILPLHSVPEGTVLTNVEDKSGDRGALGRTSGNYVTVIGHNPDEGKTRVKLPSGAKKVLPSSCRGMVGIVAGGGRTDKPLMKASRAKHKVRILIITLQNQQLTTTVRCQAQQLAQDSWCCHEPRRPSPRWW